MKKLNGLFLLMAAFALTSCDPSQNIVFVNKGKTNLKVKLTLNTAIENILLDEVKNGDSIVLNLKPGNVKETETFLYFGRGRWNAYDINEATEAIKSIEIENADHKVIYESKNALNKLLEDNKTGLFFKSIKINCEEEFD